MINTYLYALGNSRKSSYIGWTGKAFEPFAMHNWPLTEENGQTIVLVEESMEGRLAKLFKKTIQHKSGRRDDYMDRFVEK